VLGLGWQHIDSEKALKWYTQGVTSELSAQIDAYAEKKKQDILEAAIGEGGTPDKAALEAAYNELDERSDRMKDAIQQAADQAEDDWEAAHTRMQNKAVKRAQAEGK
jgi:hypothetical protein